MSILNAEMEKLVIWLQANKLSLNINKTHYMIFSSKRKKVETNDGGQVLISNLPIKRVCSTRFLGVILDERLNWQEHIACIKSKISKSIGILYKAKRVFRSSTLLSLYNTLIYPYLMYCVEVWGMEGFQI